MAITSLIKQPSCADDSDPLSIAVDEARQQILQAITPLQTREKLALRSALGRVLAEDIISPIDVPAHTNSAMDGYALNGQDLPQEEVRELTLIGSALAGQPYNGKCQSGQCVRIMTGAPMPTGTDTVIMQEQIEVVAEQRIRLGSGHRTGQNVRQAGEDIPKGAAVLSSGRQIVPADLGVLASLGFGEVTVRRRPRVAFFSTGDELRSIGETLEEGEIYDSNRYSLYGMLKRLDVEILDLGVVRDDPESLRLTLQNAAETADVIITSGGVSVGEADHIKSVLDEIGNTHFWKIAMKPGRPLTFGSIGQGHFFGLPGNPVAVMVTFYQFVQPAIHYLASGELANPMTLRARSTTRLKKKPGRYEFLRGHYTHDDSGEFIVEKAGRQGSGILTSMSRANCFILLPEDNDGVKQNGQVIIQPFDGLI
jgi:molybdopterin molybdotransferase